MSGGAPSERLFLPGGYGLLGTDGFAGDRWVVDFRGEMAAPTISVRLGHSLPGLLIAVCTAGRVEFDQVHPGGSRSGLDWAQYWATTELLTLLIWDCPRGLDDDGRRKYSTGEWPYAEAQVERLAEWERVAWRLNSTAVEAVVYRFGEGWIGITDADPDRHVSVIAKGNVEVDGLDLVEVPGTDYGWDFTKPFDMASFDPPDRPEYVDALWPTAAGRQHEEVMRTEPRPITHTREGMRYRLVVTKVNSAEGG